VSHGCSGGSRDHSRNRRGVAAAVRRRRRCCDRCRLLHRLCRGHRGGCDGGRRCVRTPVDGPFERAAAWAASASRTRQRSDRVSAGGPDAALQLMRTAAPVAITARSLTAPKLAELGCSKVFSAVRTDASERACRTLRQARLGREPHLGAWPRAAVGALVSVALLARNSSTKLWAAGRPNARPDLRVVRPITWRAAIDGARSPFDRYSAKLPRVMRIERLHSGPP